MTDRRLERRRYAVGRRNLQRVSIDERRPARRAEALQHGALRHQREEEIGIDCERFIERSQRLRQPSQHPKSERAVQHQIETARMFPARVVDQFQRLRRLTALQQRQNVADRAPRAVGRIIAHGCSIPNVSTMARRCVR